ncbi:hypothetical protein [Candidatus Binatus sp.]|uniref:hypothetical protein n=1 Tax=Candidatus Binatus sp. TaxID=2811406 RepID=UPI002F9442E0
MAPRYLTLAQLGRSQLALGYDAAALRNFLPDITLIAHFFAANLRFVSSGDLRGQFAADSLELALGGLAPADLIFGDIGLGVSHSESNAPL